jgi:hypothetical protein
VSYQPRPLFINGIPYTKLRCYYIKQLKHTKNVNCIIDLIQAKITNTQILNIHGMYHEKYVVNATRPIRK